MSYHDWFCSSLCSFLLKGRFSLWRGRSLFCAFMKRFLSSRLAEFSAGFARFDLFFSVFHVRIPDCLRVFYVDLLSVVLASFMTEDDSSMS